MRWPILGYMLAAEGEPGGFLRYRQGSCRRGVSELIKRLSALAAISALAALAAPSVAFGQGDPEPPTDEQSVVNQETATEETATEETGTQETGTEQGGEKVTTTQTTGTEDTNTIEPLDETGDTSTSSTDTSSTSTATTSSQTLVSSATTVTKAKKTKKKGRKKKGKKSRKSCSTSTRTGGLLAQKAARPAPGCTRLDGANGNLVLPDGTTLTFIETSQGVVEFTVSGGPTGTFTGTIFVKGGPASPGFACVFDGATEGTCHTPLNPNSGKLYGVSHIDACPGTVSQPGLQDEDGDRRPDRGGRGGQQASEREEAVGAAGAAVAIAAAPGEQLPVTGLPVAWLVLAGIALLASGISLKRLS